MTQSHADGLVRWWVGRALAMAVIVAVTAPVGLWIGNVLTDALDRVERASVLRVERLVGTVAYVVRKEFESGRTLDGLYFRALLPSQVIAHWSGVPYANASGNLLTPWRGEVTAGLGSTVGIGTDVPERFWVRVDALPRAACISIGNAFIERSAALEVRIGDAAPGTVARDRTAVEAGCDGGGNDGLGLVFDLEVEP